jgi:prevent-host-death family protein
VRVAAGELRNDTAGVLRRVAAGESVQITVKGQPVAELRPIRKGRSHWTSCAGLIGRLNRIQADLALRDELRGSVGGEELGRIS